MSHKWHISEQPRRFPVAHFDETASFACMNEFVVDASRDSERDCPLHLLVLLGALTTTAVPKTAITVSRTLGSVGTSCREESSQSSILAAISPISECPSEQSTPIQLLGEGRFVRIGSEKPHPKQ